MAEMEEKFFQLKIRPFKSFLNFPFLYVLFETGRYHVHIKQKEVQIHSELNVSIDAFGSVQNPFLTLLMLTLTLCVNAAFETSVFLPSKYVNVNVRVWIYT